MGKENRISRWYKEKSIKGGGYKSQICVITLNVNGLKSSIIKLRFPTAKISISGLQDAQIKTGNI